MSGIRHKNNILYYIGFYFLIFIINIFKIIKENESWIGHWRDFFSITLDLSFTWSGVIIALLTNFEKQWHNPQLDECFFYFEFTSSSPNIDSAKTEAINAFLNDSIQCIYNPNPRKENRFKVKAYIEKMSFIKIY